MVLSFGIWPGSFMVSPPQLVVTIHHGQNPNRIFLNLTQNSFSRKDQGLSLVYCNKFLGQGHWPCDLSIQAIALLNLKGK